MSQTRKRSNKSSNSKTKKQAPKEVKTANYEIKGVVALAMGILLAVGIYTSFAGFLSNISQRLAFLLLGIGGFLIPPYVIYLSICYLIGRGKITLNGKFYGFTIIFFMLNLIFATISISISDGNTSFIEGFNNLINYVKNNTLCVSGGIIGYVIAYGLNYLIGTVGSYIVYSLVIIIALIFTFDISVVDVSKNIKDKGIEYKKSRNANKKKKINIDNYNNDDYISVVPKNEKNKDEYLKGVNNKIKILDFMKNATIDEELDKINDVKAEREIEKEIVISEMKSSKNTHFIDIKETEQVDKSKEENKAINLSKKKESAHEECLEENVNNEIDKGMNSQDEIRKEYKFPGLDLLNINNKTKLNSSDKKELIESAAKLTEILGNFGVSAKVNQVSKGPSVTRYELQPSPGVKVSKIVNLADDIALGLAASGVRIEAPIPGKAAVGIEVPNKKQTAVYLSEVLESEEFISSHKKLAFALGKDIAGECIVGDLSKMPHTLIAGATGSGKSVCINSLIISILYKYKPEDVKLLMVDPKVVELNVYNGIPHLLIPVVTDPKKAAAALNWAVNEMTKRYNLFAEKGVRNIDSYNNLYKKGEVSEKLPFVVIIVDELADLMMVCPNDVEDAICRLAQMARAAGMHLVIATQRPSVDVITGVIKANIPSRISFAVSSQIDSRTILDSSGAEKLLGKGDMLYYPVGESKPLRVQGCFISEEEVEKVVDYIKQEESEVNYREEIIEHINKEAKDKEENSNSNTESDIDDLLDEATKIVVEYNQASTSFLQRRLRIGFNRASRIMEQLEERGVISERDGTKPRQVLLTKNDLVAENNNEE